MYIYIYIDIDVTVKLFRKLYRMDVKLCIYVEKMNF